MVSCLSAPDVFCWGARCADRCMMKNLPTQGTFKQMCPQSKLACVPSPAIASNLLPALLRIQRSVVVKHHIQTVGVGLAVCNTVAPVCSCWHICQGNTAAHVPSNIVDLCKLRQAFCRPLCSCTGHNTWRKWLVVRKVVERKANALLWAVGARRRGGITAGRAIVCSSSSTALSSTGGTTIPNRADIAV